MLGLTQRQETGDSKFQGGWQALLSGPMAVRAAPRWAQASSALPLAYCVALDKSLCLSESRLPDSSNDNSARLATVP